jgi:hypothetical protein
MVPPLLSIAQPCPFGTTFASGLGEATYSLGVTRRCAFFVVLVACGACTAADDGASTTDAGDDANAFGNDFDVASPPYDGSPFWWDSHFDPPWGDAPDAMPPAPRLRCGVRTSPVDGALADADAATEPCDPPPSTCADRYWLVYFTNGTCVRGTCFFEEKALLCPEGCENGGCRPAPTTK